MIPKRIINKRNLRDLYHLYTRVDGPSTMPRAWAPLPARIVICLSPSRAVAFTPFMNSGRLSMGTKPVHPSFQSESLTETSPSLILRIMVFIECGPLKTFRELRHHTLAEGLTSALLGKPSDPPARS